MIIPINVDSKKVKEKIIFTNFTAEKLSPECLDEDYQAVIENESLIKETRGNAGDWPNPNTLTKKENFLDLAWHQREFEYGLSFAFVLRDLNEKYMGCAYLYPMNFRSIIENASDYELDFSFWLTQEFYILGKYELVKSEFMECLKQIGFSKIYYSNLK